MQPHLYSFKKLIRTMMCESQLCIPITWFAVLKWLILWKWPFSVIFWSRNVKRFWKKSWKNSNSWREIKIVKIFLMLSLLCKKRSWKNVSKIALLENNQKHFLRYYFGWCSSEMAELVLPLYSYGRSTYYSGRSCFSINFPRCYNDVYANIFFPCTARLLNSVPAKCFPQTFDPNGF